jgi:hypothetical protein
MAALQSADLSAVGHSASAAAEYSSRDFLGTTARPRLRSVRFGSVRFGSARKVIARGPSGAGFVVCGFMGFSLNRSRRCAQRVSIGEVSQKPRLV